MPIPGFYYDGDQDYNDCNLVNYGNRGRLKDYDKNDKKINLPPPEVSPGGSIREEGVAKKQRVGGGLKPPWQEENTNALLSGK